jgi:hypothetical protein
MLFVSESKQVTEAGYLHLAGTQRSLTGRDLLAMLWSAGKTISLQREKDAGKSFPVSETFASSGAKGLKKPSAMS